MNDRPTIRKRTRPVKVTNTVEKASQSSKNEAKPTMAKKPKKKGHTLKTKEFKKTRKAFVNKTQSTRELPTFPYPPIAHEHQQMPPLVLREDNPFMQAELITDYGLPRVEVSTSPLVSNEPIIPESIEEVEVEYEEMKFETTETTEQYVWANEVPEQLLADEEIKSEDNLQPQTKRGNRSEESMTTEAFKKLREERASKKMREVTIEDPNQTEGEEPTALSYEEPGIATYTFEKIQRGKGQIVVTPEGSYPARMVSERLPEIRNWRALVTNCAKPTTPPHFFPTQFLTVTGDYLSEFRNLRCPHFGNTIDPRISKKDGAHVRVETVHTGEIFITRFGQRAQIRSAYTDRKDPHRTAGQRYFPKLIEVKEDENGKNVQEKAVTTAHPSKKKRKNKNPMNPNMGIKTEDIPVRCPYWAKLVEDLVYPPTGHTTFTTNSTYDGVRVVIIMYADGRVFAKRNQYRVQLLPEFEMK